MKLYRRFFECTYLNLKYINNSTRNIVFPTKIDNCSNQYDKRRIFQKFFRISSRFYFPKKNSFKGQTSSILSTRLYTYPPL